MPIYEYRCPGCKRRVSVLFRSLAAVDHAKATCTYCGGRGLERLVSRVRVLRGTPTSAGPSGEDAGMDDLEREMSSLDESDPRSLGRFMRKVASQARDDGAEAFGPEFDEVVNRLERGESPEAIEGSMGDAFGGEASDGMDDMLGAPPPPDPAPVEPPAPKSRRPRATASTPKVGEQRKKKTRKTP
ncbi:MAG TPA: zinc ribbon domain-containing protein [Thermoflexales bacterium]|nr:zinc ribbon domain-containing protein [Anaerolineae bacterium]HQV28978.1 zinc ribbon domain-containing protein [Thermoflexales bacterium]HQX12393.1 zinc ribbon domain-containing protein [Thermoflexales bacterium]HQY25159.1 zinc ribbon domain-containing protein [Thermoflexales bacterium]HQZ54878.1 zinc ribbon domain-containing protein [Thermoflexales bacterium]